jgi:putative acetyltransferase
MTNIENDQNIIIEGCYFPESINDLGKEYLNKIVFLYIIFSEQYIQKNIMEKIYKNRNIIENRGYDFEGEYMKDYTLTNIKNKEICKNNGIKYFEIKEDYEEEINNIYEWIDEEIKDIK